MKPEGYYYDPDEDVRPSSPGLVPTQIDYHPKETPPPYIQTSSSSSSVSPGPGESKDDQHGLDASPHPPAKKKLKKKRRKKDPNRPDIAREAAKRALNSASQSEAEDEAEREMGGDGDDEDDDSRAQEDHNNSAHASELIARAALYDVEMEDPAPEKPVVSASLAIHGAVNGAVGKPGLSDKDAPQSASLSVVEDSTAPLKLLHPPLPLKIVAATSEAEGEVEDDSIATSPALAKWAISAAEANPDSTLPAMQKSPPRSASTHSPGGTQSLPSLQTALSQIIEPAVVETPSGLSPFSQNPGQSPTMTRAQYIAGNAGPSPGVYSHPSPAASKDMTSMSPPGYPTHSSYWRTTPKEGSFSTTSPASVPGLTPVASYPTPKELTSPESNATPQTLSGPLSANGPFTTQYLLNSHANVHSSSRPHYCPVKTCPRSLGGKGFKRKNEMIRHGLVHDSPGYVCPFCADQQHKYPRPDNLQRHVRVHHPDKERDDPQLCSVLALRSREGSRGRRRRVGA